ncbi:hypothetical protein C2E23DRAFT_887423 [Lenzites betulinus]|nr:hypothetical protein C2E23DRAFT_887423 [Lenzites betulinus]
MANTNQTAKQPAYPEVTKDLLLKAKDYPDLPLTVGAQFLSSEAASVTKGCVSSAVLEALGDVSQTAVVLRLLQSNPQASVPLVAKAQGIMECASWDGGKPFVPDWFLVFPKHKLTAKADKPVAGTRVSEYDHLIIGEKKAFWPPPVQLPTGNGRASQCWEVDVASEGPDSDWSVGGEDLAELLQHSGGVTFVAFRLLNQKGVPSKRWVIRIVWQDQGSVSMAVAHQDFKSSSGLEFRAVLRCALCSISPPWSSYHDHTQCPYLGTLNKVRENLGYEHIRVEINSQLAMPRTKRAIDFDKFVAELTKWKADVDRKLGELFAAQKGGKKRKAADDAPGPSKPTKTPKKEEKDKGKGKGKQEEGSKDAKGKGKAKAAK